MKLFPLISLCLGYLALASCTGYGKSRQSAPPAVIECETTCTVPLGARAQFGTIWVRPLEVLEDSRCPSGVQCVWAGRVLLRMDVGRKVEAEVTGSQSRSDGIEIEIENAKPVLHFGHNLMLENVRPANVSTAGKINPADYRFTFAVRKPGPAD